MKSLCLAVAIVMGLVAPLSAEGRFQSPTILVLGDSQISFGSGPVFLDFFENIEKSCPASRRRMELLAPLTDRRVAVIGVRSTSLQSWTSTKGPTKGALCKVDRKWKVNAGTYGVINNTGNKYKQIGQGAEYQFCKKGKTAFDVMFRPDYYNPRLIFMSFLGNSARRWADHYDKALEDVRKMNAQLPEGVPCVFMTTAPSYSKKVTALRLKAQVNIKRAFAETGSHCSFVEGYSPETVAANQGNKQFFRRNKSGRVKDPYHPNEKAARKFFMIEMKQICGAVYQQLEAKTDRRSASSLSGNNSAF